VRRVFVGAVVVLLVAALGPTSVSARSRIFQPGVDDATVVAVIDFNFVPYHWDFLASKMPQHLDSDPSNNLPLDRAPHEWLPGFASPKSFDSYNQLKLNLEEKKPDAELAQLSALDQKKWAGVKLSTREELNYYWMPGTKVIGALDFGGSRMLGAPGDHGQGTTSSSVGNLHGTCPECLLVFININTVEDGEAAIEWALDQPWIDAISNSYGFSAAVRDRLYSGSDVKAQRRASERGQTVFFSAGNGQDGSFVAPNTTHFSSQEGPDWIVTVGAISPGEDNYYYREGYTGHEADQTAYHSSYSGHGKPSDVAGIGSNYPSAYTAETVGATGSSGFGGTSNATPQITGTYARALYLSRLALDGPSRIQKDGVIATGSPFACGKARRDCELRDGKLTASELRTRLFHGAVHTAAGMTPAGYGSAPPIGEEEFLNEGHGSYFGRETRVLFDYLKEFQRIMGPLTGAKKALKRPEGEREWMIVDSYCRQNLWGSWKGGYYVEGKTELPGSDPQYPTRSQMEATCEYWVPPL
jgi:Subtilase family